MKLPSYGFLIPASLLLGLAPFVPEPHLVEKIRWLFTGHAFKPIDVFDLFLHGTFPALLLVKAGRDAVGRVRGSGGRAVDGPGTSAPAGKGGSRSGESGEHPGTPDTRAQRRRKERERKRN
jgi:hypothetical protein